jgi:hypothetical protein|tara:strand:+ start:1079 stop:1297 length:219 start_codon:yes stop_codon:yes gene_type:complete
MKYKEKHYIECSFDLLIEVDKKDREKVIRKLNGILSSALKDEKVIKALKSINFMSESDVLMASLPVDPTDFN